MYLQMEAMRNNLCLFKITSNICQLPKYSNKSLSMLSGICLLDMKCCKTMCGWFCIFYDSKAKNKANKRTNHCVFSKNTKCFVADEKLFQAYAQCQCTMFLQRASLCVLIEFTALNSMRCTQWLLFLILLCLASMADDFTQLNYHL